MPGQPSIRNVLLLAFMTFSGVVAFGQQTYFAYLQTENRQPFYVKMNNQRYSSTVSGYVIIPNLTGGKHDLQIGFPKNEWGEQSVSMDLEQKDQGYLLKQFGDKGWGLFNLQTFAISMAASKDKPTPGVDAGEFAGMLSEVVKDPGIAKPEDAKSVKKTPAENPVDKPVVKAESKPAESEPDKTQKSQSSTAPQPEYSVIVKQSQSSTGKGLQLEYTDRTGDRTDTIRILIEDSKSANDEASTAANSGSQPNTGENPAAVAPPASSCSSLASESVFMKLRKRLAGESEKERMLSLSKKAFKDNCYTTEQVRNLSGLFLSDEARYAFFDLAYPFVVDPKQFPTLQSQLIDPYYQSRFRAMLRQ